jgi:hypothetical protein
MKTKYVKCLCVVQGGCDICIRFNQKFMFCTNRGIHLSFWLFWEYAASALENVHFTMLCYRDFHFTVRYYGIPILPPAGRINVTFQRFDHGRKLNLQYGCDKNVIPRESWFNYDDRLPLCLSFKFLRLYSTYGCNENFEWLIKLSFGMKVIQQRTFL